MFEASNEVNIEGVQLWTGLIYTSRPHYIELWLKGQT